MRIPSAVSGRQWPAESPAKKTPSSVAGRSLCGIQLPWYPSRRQAPLRDQPHGRVLDVVARVERADPDAQLVVRRERPAVAGADHALVDPDLEVLAAAAGMHLQPARETRVRGLDPAGAEDPLPSQRVDDQRGAHVAAIGVHDLAVAAVDLRDLELRPGPALLPEQRAQEAIVEGREGPAERPARARARRVTHQRAERLPDRGLEPEVAQPLRRRRAGGGLAFADLVAIEHQHARPGRAQLARDREAGERGAADQDVELAADRRALGAALCGSDRHRRAGIIGKLPSARNLEVARVIRCLWKPP